MAKKGPIRRHAKGNLLVCAHKGNGLDANWLVRPLGQRGDVTKDVLIF